MSNFFIELLGALGGGNDHLTQNRFFLFEFCKLVLEVAVLFFLVDHAHLQISVEGFDEWMCGIHNLIVDVLYFVFHCHQLLSEEFDKLMVFLKIFIGFTHQVLELGGSVPTPYPDVQQHWWSSGWRKCLQIGSPHPSFRSYNFISI